MSVIRYETFRWHFHIFDIKKINENIRLGILSGDPVTLPRCTIEWFSESILGLKDLNARLIPQAPLIDRDYAKTLTAPRIDHPIVLMEISRSSVVADDLSAGLDLPGTLRYEPRIGHILKPANLSTADVVLIDGNDRLASAYYQHKESIHGILLRENQTTNYLWDEH
jgi:hypothetical protein